MKKLLKQESEDLKAKTKKRPEVPVVIATNGPLKISKDAARYLARLLMETNQGRDRP
jgi:hypothetical protein